MIAAYDSSRGRPTLDQVRAARAAGIRMWWGYLVSLDDAAVLAAREQGEGLLGLVAPWTSGEFATVRAGGLVAGAFGSGNDDPAALGAKARSLGLTLGLDDENGIRPVGGWEQAWLDAARAGLYGPLGNHAGVSARFHIAALYPGSDPGATWPPGVPRPPGALGWQWQGTHVDPVTGLEVDSSWLDDWFGQQGGEPMQVSCARPDGGRDVYTVMPGGQLRHVVLDFDGQVVFSDTPPGDWSATIACGYRGREPYFQGLGTDVSASAFEIVDPGPGWSTPAAKP